MKQKTVRVSDPGLKTEGLDVRVLDPWPGVKYCGFGAAV